MAYTVSNFLTWTWPEPIEKISIRAVLSYFFKVVLGSSIFGYKLVIAPMALILSLLLSIAIIFVIIEVVWILVLIVLQPTIGLADTLGIPIVESDIMGTIKHAVKYPISPIVDKVEDWRVSKRTIEMIKEFLEIEPRDNYDYGSQPWDRGYAGSYDPYSVTNPFVVSKSFCSIFSKEELDSGEDERISEESLSWWWKCFEVK